MFVVAFAFALQTVREKNGNNYSQWLKLMVLYPILTCFVSVKLLFGFLIHSLVLLHSVNDVCVCVCA